MSTNGPWKQTYKALRDDNIERFFYPKLWYKLTETLIKSIVKQFWAL